MFTSLLSKFTFQHQQMPEAYQDLFVSSIVPLEAVKFWKHSNFEPTEHPTSEHEAYWVRMQESWETLMPSKSEEPHPYFLSPYEGQFKSMVA
jgi:hypothetical protein